MPLVYIWSPNKEHSYGHAALQTDKYHISFWPDGNVKEFGLGKTVTEGVDAALIFHQELDLFYEGNRQPTDIYEIVNATNEAINSIHEEFLSYNGIDPANVTLEAAEELLEKKKKPEISVPKTPYTFVAEIDGQTSVLNVISSTSSRSGSLHSEPFYYRKQSCVSFCFNIIQMADPKPQGIPSRLTDILTSQTLDNFTVPWFQSYIQRYWVKDKHVADNAFGRIKKYWLG